MKKPRPIDYNLNEKIIHEIESSVEQEKIVEKKYVRLSKWTGVILFYCIFCAILIPFLGLIALGVSLIPAYLLAAVLAPAIGKKITILLQENGIQNRKEFKNYLSYKTDLNDYHNQYFTNMRKFWINLTKLEFKNKVVNLLKKAGYKIKTFHSLDGSDIKIFFGEDTQILFAHVIVPLSLNELKNLYEEIDRSNAGRAIIISTGGFKQECYNSEVFTSVTLWDINRLIEIQQKLDQ